MFAEEGADVAVNYIAPAAEEVAESFAPRAAALSP